MHTVQDREDFIARLPLADFASAGQLPSPADVEYAFKFAEAVYGTGGKVDNAKDRKKMCEMCGLGEEAILCARMQSETLRPAFACFLDHARKRCLLCVRGTASVEDALTNTVADPSMEQSLGGEVHTGILEAARVVVEEARPGLARAAASYPEYDLVVTGHSLAAGVAALATLLLDGGEPRAAGFSALHGIGFATPCIASSAVASSQSASRCFTTIICARDAIARTCVSNVYLLQHQVAMAGMRTSLLDALASGLGHQARAYSERRHRFGDERALERGGKKYFPVGKCVVIADPGRENAKALLAQPEDIDQPFLHEDMMNDHSIERYELSVGAIRALGCKASNVELGVLWSPSTIVRTARFTVVETTSGHVASCLGQHGARSTREGDECEWWEIFLKGPRCALRSAREANAASLSHFSI